MNKIVKTVPSGWNLKTLMETLLTGLEDEYLVVSNVNDITFSKYGSTVSFNKMYENISSDQPLYCIKCDELTDENLYTRFQSSSYDITYQYKNFKIRFYYIVRWFNDYSYNEKQEVVYNNPPHTIRFQCILYIGNNRFGYYDSSFSADSYNKNDIIKLCENENELIEKYNHLYRLCTSSFSEKTFTFNHVYDYISKTKLEYFAAKSAKDLTEEQLKQYRDFVDNIISSAEYLFPLNKTITIKGKSVKYYLKEHTLKLYIGGFCILSTNNVEVYKYLFSPLIWLFAQIIYDEKTYTAFCSKIMHHIYLSN